MNENELAELSLEAFQSITGITCNWQNVQRKEIDGIVELSIEGKKVALNVEVKQQLRSHNMDDIIQRARKYSPLMIISKHIFPKIKEELRHNGISYLELSGNVFIKHRNVYLLVDGQKAAPTESERGNRAFTKTGLKVLFYFLQEKGFVNMPYREIAAQASVGLGNIGYVINGLKEQGFLLKRNKYENQITNAKALLDKWVSAYEERLKPSLSMGTFRFLKDADFSRWKGLPLNTQKTVWGGEPAGDLYTDHLRPAQLTLYTSETKNELIKHYRLIPDENGNVKVWKRFWHYDRVNDNVAPPILVYADLMNMDDKRCRETAQIIYEQLIQPNL